MAQDPYGFNDTAPPNPSGGATASGDAAQAMWLALTAAMLGSIGICFCYVPYVVALPMGAYAAYLGSRALQTETNPERRAMATSGLVGGVTSGVVGGIFTLFFLLYLVLMVMYVGIIIFAVGAGAAAEAAGAAADTGTAVGF